jgi:hypothetical protein
MHIQGDALPPLQKATIFVPIQTLLLFQRQSKVVDWLANSSLIYVVFSCCSRPEYAYSGREQQLKTIQIFWIGTKIVVFWRDCNASIIFRISMMNLGSVTATLLYRRFAVNSEISCNSSTCRSLTYNARRTGTETYHRLFRRYTRRGAQCVPWWWIGELLWWGLSGNNLTTVDYTLNGSFLWIYCEPSVEERSSHTSQIHHTFMTIYIYY